MKTFKIFTVFALFVILVMSCKKDIIDPNVDAIFPIKKIEFSVTVSDVTSHNGNDGSATINITSGTEPFRITLNDDSTLTHVSRTFSGLTAGTYTVLVTDGADQSLSKEFEITEPDMPILSFDVDTTNVSAWGLSDGKIIVINVTGVPPFTFSIEGGELDTIGLFIGLKSGTYNVTVTDAKGQSLSKEFEITEPEMPALSFDVAIIHVSAWGLSDGKIYVLGFKGVSPFTFSIEGEDVNKTGYEWEFTGLKSGTYNVTVTDAKGQNETTIVYITQPEKIRIAPVMSMEEIDLRSYTGAAYNTAKTSIITAFSNYFNVLRDRNTFSISFWYNTSIGDNLNKFNPDYTEAILVHAIPPISPNPGAGTMYVALNKEYIEYTFYGFSEVSQNDKNKIRYISRTVWLGLHHIVIMYDGKNMKLYIDNDLIDSVPSTIRLHTEKLYFGGFASNNNSEYGGVISKVKLYNDAIDDEEIDNLYNNL